MLATLSVTTEASDQEKIETVESLLHFMKELPIFSNFDKDQYSELARKQNKEAPNNPIDEYTILAILEIKNFAGAMREVLEPLKGAPKFVLAFRVHFPLLTLYEKDLRALYQNNQASNPSYQDIAEAFAALNAMKLLNCKYYMEGRRGVANEEHLKNTVQSFIAKHQCA